MKKIAISLIIVVLPCIGCVTTNIPEDAGQPPCKFACEEGKYPGQGKTDLPSTKLVRPVVPEQVNPNNAYQKLDALRQEMDSEVSE